MMRAIRIRISCYAARAAVALICLVSMHTAASAQSAISMSAIVPIASPGGAGATRNLQFGTVTITPGSTKTVDVPASATPQGANIFAAEFAYGVAGMVGMDVSLTLPTTLVSTVGNVPMAISFSGTQYGGQCVTVGAGTCTLAQFDPSAGGVVRVCAGYKGNGTCKNQVFAANSTAHLYVGGIITVPPTQVAATYTGTITSFIVQVY